METLGGCCFAGEVGNESLGIVLAEHVKEELERLPP